MKPLPLWGQMPHRVDAGKDQLPSSLISHEIEQELDFERLALEIKLNTNHRARPS